ncbi:MAG TPA: hypothetical protein VFX20_17395 [Steroidobacteraceae bacterium]|nr:hypothetical protein [Steroidobacteraceae bacterium]
MTALRVPLLLGTALIAAAGCAQQPKRADYTAPAAVAAATPNPAITAASARTLTRAFPPRLLVFAYDQGWRQVVIAGKDHYFCRTDAPPGSMIPGPRCLSQSELQTEQLLIAQEQEKLRQPIPYLPMK